MPTALVTGAAGFIGYFTSKRLLAEGYDVVGLDAMSDYYDVALKQARLKLLAADERFEFVQARVEDEGVLANILSRGVDLVVHLAAQAGVRFSIEQPRAYLDSNIRGTFELLEAARAHPVKHLMIASTSSAYGANDVYPYVEAMRTDHQMSFYAATKKACEAMSHSYAHLYNIPTTCFRFFTVYGPWGRPDMAPYKFTKAILEGTPIDVYNHGNMKRDFTYVEDLVDRLVALAAHQPETGKPAEHDSLSPVAPWRVVNIGRGKPVELADFIAAIETAAGRKAKQNLLPMQAGDVPATWADTTLVDALLGPQEHQTSLEKGVQAFVDWYRGYYGV
ncbi:SDR family NAD(P)-dependent oxidoreductase [Lentibacter algarum]|uniref:SDR family NAD(P)-dependent oxidoreductase n=1 Tax=Lentibacter algarum TaxID=576131 RepID=UPI001C06ECCD|nr:SDR family NAD(P)-dependent oxidoreductase [Lentibacter algarum]MBU2981484.1 SDR family NAD(P)-dependent oxidoreductase [Lentibacter algarum]